MIFSAVRYERFLWFRISFNPIFELDTTDPTRDDICYTGNLLEPIKNTKKPFRPIEGKKYVFVYLGTGSVSLKKAITILPHAFQNQNEIICYVASQSINKDSSIGNVNFTVSRIWSSIACFSRSNI